MTIVASIHKLTWNDALRKVLKNRLALCSLKLVHSIYYVFKCEPRCKAKRNLQMCNLAQNQGVRLATEYHEKNVYSFLC